MIRYVDILNPLHDCLRWQAFGGDLGLVRVILRASIFGES